MRDSARQIARNLLRTGMDTKNVQQITLLDDETLEQVLAEIDPAERR